MKEEWTNNLRKQVGDYEADVPAGLLDGIKQELSRRETKAERRRGFVVPLPVIRRVAAAAVVVLVTAVCLWTMRPAGDSRQPTETIASVSNHTGGKAATASGENAGRRPDVRTQLASASGALACDAVPARTAAAHDKAMAETMDQPMMKTAEEAAVTTAASADGYAAKVVEAPMAKAQKKSKAMAKQGEDAESSSKAMVQEKRSYNSFGGSYDTAPVPQPHRQGRLRIGASYQGNGMSSSQSGGTAMANTLYSAKLPGVLEGDAFTKDDRRSEVKAKHNQPVRAGVTVRYEVTPRWGVQTGLTYSYLQSSFDVSLNGVTNSTDQSLHYLGVPVSVTFDAWRCGRFGVYALAGGMGEMLVDGKAKSSYTMGGKEWQQQSSRVKDSRVLWSVNAAVGVECEVVKRVALYVEPGCSYHFDNGSSVKSAYTDRRCDFDLNFGLRVKLP